MCCENIWFPKATVMHTKNCVCVLVSHKDAQIFWHACTTYANSVLLTDFVSKCDLENLHLVTHTHTNTHKQRGGRKEKSGFCVCTTQSGLVHEVAHSAAAAVEEERSYFPQSGKVL